ncbi:helix-turn-helix domain-containing protein [Tritonibacter mobilis]|uniref:helix-turn-helix domain-containing protein n=1 Tax=Tritonibacter mobilis TaxID=379347 RepID=UPI0009BD9B2A|nr:AraC family transcriptional regulator [Tritonibacter mobilis]
MSLDSSASDTSQPVELCLSGVETVALKTAAVDIEVQRAKAAPDTGIAWTKTRFRSNGPDTVEVVSNRPADFVFTQVPLGGSFAAELTCGTHYESETVGLVRPRDSGALFRLQRSEADIFGVNAPLEMVERWFAGKVPKAVQRILDGMGGPSLVTQAPLPSYLRISLEQALHSRLPLRTQLIEAAALQILCYQLEALSTDSSPGIATHEVQAAREAHAMLEAEAMAPPGLGELASRLGLAANRLALAYREVFGCTLVQSTEQVRLHAACDAILGGAPIKLVASQLGYASVSSFTYAFRKKMGMPPRKWRDAQARRVNRIRSDF